MFRYLRSYASLKHPHGWLCSPPTHPSPAAHREAQTPPPSHLQPSREDTEAFPAQRDDLGPGSAPGLLPVGHARNTSSVANWSPKTGPGEGARGRAVPVVPAYTITYQNLTFASLKCN